MWLIEALKKETGVAEWELSTQRQREQGWEWEALNPGRGLRARVKVASSPEMMASVYQYPTAPESADHNTRTPLAADDRLVVTPLGGALGIEANCFRVEMGSYEIVLDCGTRTIGHSTPSRRWNTLSILISCLLSPCPSRPHWSSASLS